MTRRTAAAGPLIDLGVHVNWILSAISPACPKPVSAFGVTYNNLGCDRASSEKGWVSSSKGRDFKYDVEDFASALIRFDSGLTLQIEASFNLNIRSDTGSIELFGTKAGAKLDPDVELFTDMSQPFRQRQALRLAPAGSRQTASSMRSGISSIACATARPASAPPRTAWSR